MLNRSRLAGALLSIVLAAPAAAFAAAPVWATTTDPLPACRYDDVLTARTAYVDWNKTLLDPIDKVADTYVPPDLAYTIDAGITGGGRVRSVAIADLRAMTVAAKAAGGAIAVSSAYRSYATQAALFDSDVTRLGYEGALLHTARPGHSEHQLGTTIDFKSKQRNDRSPDGDWASTRAGRWMATHAWEYGWVMSYPKDKTSVTCYGYEPWHYRYFGRVVARQIKESGLTTREWLWQQGYGLPGATGSVVRPESGSELAPAA